MRGPFYTSCLPNTSVSAGCGAIEPFVVFAFEQCCASTVPARREGLITPQVKADALSVEERKLRQRTGQLRAFDSLSEEIAELEQKRYRTEDEIQELTFARREWRSLKEGFESWPKQEREIALKAYRETKG